MSNRESVRAAEKSYQQRDPLGGYSVRPVTLILTLLTIGYAGYTTINGWQTYTVPVLAIGALGMSIAASIGLAFWSSPLRAPFPAMAMIWVVGVGNLAVVLAAAAVWNDDPLISAAWAPFVVGVGITQLAPYRPARELVAATLVSSAVVILLVVIRPAVALQSRPEPITIIEVTVPLFTLGMAAVAYAFALGSTLDFHRNHADRGVREATDQARGDILRSVRHDRVTILNLHVVPFFTDLLQRGSIRRADSERAGAIAESIRSVMIADVERSWLDAVIEQSAPEALGSAPGVEMVEDDERLASAMTTEQRTATRALLVALFEHPGFDADGFGVVLTRRGTICVFTLTAKLDNEDAIHRSAVAPYIAVQRIVFSNLQLAFRSPTLTLRFSYEHS